MLSTVANGSAIQLPRTGQTNCYNNTGAPLLSCAGTGQDGDLLAGVPWPSQRFSAGSGALAGCITDNLTGLMWVQSPATSTSNWQTALDYANTTLNASGGLCGFTDWRMPGIVELESLVNAGQPDQSVWLNTQGFSNILTSGIYLSSTSYPTSKSIAYHVYMNEGSVTNGNFKNNTGFNLLAVRGTPAGAPADVWESGQQTCSSTAGGVVLCGGTGQDGDKLPGVAWPNPRFTANGNGTVTDNLTGLIWLKNADCFGKQEVWASALISANTLKGDNSLCSLNDGSTAGDWRLPNKKELFSLMDYEYSAPAVANTAGTGKWAAGDPFDNVQSGLYWSSSTDEAGAAYAWAANFNNAVIVGMAKTTIANFGYHVWPVRGGQVVILKSLTISTPGPGSGTVTSNPAGINCGSSCTARFPRNGTVVLSAVPTPGGSVFSGWTGDAGCGDRVVLDTNKNCTATFDFCQAQASSPAEIGSTTFGSIALAYAGAGVPAAADIIKIIGSNQLENLVFNDPGGKNITLQGGYDCTFTTQGAPTIISGSLTVYTGSVIFDRIAIGNN